LVGFRHELSEAQWRLVEPILPANGGRGGQWRCHRELLDAMFWKLNTGAGWRDLPERYGPWQSVYDRFRRWEHDGTFARILAVLRLQLDEPGRIDWDTWCVDGSNIRAGRAAAGAKKGAPKSRWAAPTAAGARKSIS